jgi:hypothetical protein
VPLLPCLLLPLSLRRSWQLSSLRRSWQLSSLPLLRHLSHLLLRHLPLLLR